MCLVYFPVGFLGSGLIGSLCHFQGCNLFLSASCTNFLGHGISWVSVLWISISSIKLLYSSSASRVPVLGYLTRYTLSLSRSLEGSVIVWPPFSGMSSSAHVGVLYHLAQALRCSAFFLWVVNSGFSGIICGCGTVVFPTFQPFLNIPYRCSMIAKSQW